MARQKLIIATFSQRVKSACFSYQQSGHRRRMGPTPTSGITDSTFKLSVEAETFMTKLIQQKMLKIKITMNCMGIRISWTSLDSSFHSMINKVVLSMRSVQAVTQKNGDWVIHDLFLGFPWLLLTSLVLGNKLANKWMYSSHVVFWKNCAGSSEQNQARFGSFTILV